MTAAAFDAARRDDPRTAAVGSDGVDPCTAAVGNDVVDLRDADARPGARHPRFDARAFYADERAWIGRGPGANGRRWALWAAKEAAHKALRQEDARLGFAPRHYRVTLDADGAGVVRRGDATIAVRVATSPERVHAVAFRGDAADLHWAVAPLGAEAPDPGAAARALLLATLPPGARARLRRRGRIPRLAIGGRPLAVSLSHHGRFVAVARRAVRP